MKMVLSTEEEKKRMELWEKGYTDSQIGKTCGVCYTTINHWRKKHNLKSNSKGQGRRLEDSEEKLRCDLFTEGYTDAEIAEVVNISKSAVSLWRSNRKLQHHHLTNDGKYGNLTSEELKFYNYLKEKRSDLDERTLLALAKYYKPRSDTNPSATLRRHVRKSRFVDVKLFSSTTMKNLIL